MAQTTGRGEGPSRPLPASRGRRARPYGARITAFAAKRGKTPAELTPDEKRAARGHPNESAERKERYQETKRKYGVTPASLRKLRKAALEHILSELHRVGTKNPPDRDEIWANLLPLGGEGLALILQTSGDELRRMASYQRDFNRNGTMHRGKTVSELFDSYPEFQNDEDINPIWYTR